ncbi:hypothetical protein ACHAWF_010105, partial [Thalassiosira exigua]
GNGGSYSHVETLLCRETPCDRFFNEVKTDLHCTPHDKHDASKQLDHRRALYAAFCLVVVK